MSTTQNPHSDLPLFSSGLKTQDDVQLPKHLTVSELTSQIRGTLEPAFHDIWVQGEVSNFRPAASGHVYFSLKDSQASISAALFGWGSAKRRRPFDIKDGMQILCRGRISVYPPRGSYQLIVEEVEPLGAGALQLAFEQLKEKLAAEGLFRPERKRPIPRFPREVVVITSPTGAAIRDILNVMHRRAPQVRVKVIPAIVQGDGAAPKIARALEIANQHRMGDLVILARGGGSIEDLWCFNDESLARKIAASELPVISAVGHEIDFTISDFVSDLRAPTPSAAAELATGSWVECTRQLLESKERLTRALLRDLQTRKNLLSHIAARVVNPRDRLREQSQRCDELFLRLTRSIAVGLEGRKARVEQLMGKLDALSPLRVLERGFAIVKSDEDNSASDLIRSAAQVMPGQKLRIAFYDGETSVQAT